MKEVSFGFRGAWPELILRAGVLKRFSLVTERDLKTGEAGGMVGMSDDPPSLVTHYCVHTAQRC